MEQADDAGPTKPPARKRVRWSQKMREEFLDHLAATCNVKASAEAIEVDPISVYHLRRKDDAFAEAWGTALALGYEMLETQLVGHALAGGGREITNGAVAEIGPIDTDLALRLLSTHRGHALGKRGKGGPTPHEAKPDETDAAILRKLSAIERSRSRPA